MIEKLRQSLETFVWSNRISQHGRVGRLVAGALRYLYAVLRDVFSGQLTLRAMSLVYTTLLSIVPLLAFSFSVLKGLGIHEEVANRLYLFLQPLGSEAESYTNTLLGLVQDVNGKLLGGLGLAFLLYTVISMVQKTEESFNYVWYVNKPRSFARRFVEYAFVLLIGPVFIFIALGMISGLQSAALVEYLLSNDLISRTVVALGELVPYIIVCALFTFLYMFIPNTKVSLKAAAIGGLAGGVMWATSGVLFATFVVTSTTRNAIYASFTVPLLALIWVYVNWLILLIGSQLAFYVQNPAYLRVGRKDPRLSNAMRERIALNIMLLVGQEFRQPASGVNTAALASELKIPGLTLAPILNRLEEAGLLSITEKEKLQPGREMARISLNDILAAVRVDGNTGSYRNPKWNTAVDAIGGEIDTAIAATLGDKSLADLLDGAPN